MNKILQAEWYIFKNICTSIFTNTHACDSN